MSDKQPLPISITCRDDWSAWKSNLWTSAGNATRIAGYGAVAHAWWCEMSNGAHRRATRGPGARLLKLRGQPEQRRFVAKAPDEVTADGQALFVPIQRHGHGRLTCDVADRRERHKDRCPLHTWQRIVGLRVE